MKPDPIKSHRKFKESKAEEVTAAIKTIVAGTKEAKSEKFSKNKFIKELAERREEILKEEAEDEDEE